MKEDKHLCGEGGRIGPNGMIKLLGDLKIQPENISALILAWKFGAEVQCEFSLKEFRHGFRTLGYAFEYFPIYITFLAFRLLSS